MVKLEVPKIEIEDEFSTNCSVCSVVIEKSHDGRREESSTRIYDNQ